MKQTLVIMGCGGHARSVADVAIHCGYSDFVFVDEHAREHEFCLDFPVNRQAPSVIEACFIAYGDTYQRKEAINHVLGFQWPLVTIFSPHATRGVGSSFQWGTIVAHHAHIGPMASIGMGCIINTGAIIEHDCQVGDFSHVSVNATLAGRVIIGQHVLIGAGAVVRDRVVIGDYVTVGAGATVVHDLLTPGVYVGTPARLMG